MRLAACLLAAAALCQPAAVGAQEEPPALHGAYLIVDLSHLKPTPSRGVFAKVWPGSGTPYFVAAPCGASPSCNVEIPVAPIGRTTSISVEVRDAAPAAGSVDPPRGSRVIGRASTSVLVRKTPAAAFAVPHPAFI